MMAAVMIVEDDEAFGYVLERQLLDAGHKVTRFLDWNGVLESLEAGDEIDVLVTDLRLPQGTPNGVSLAMMAKARRSKLKIVYMTAFEDVASTVRSTFPAVILKTEDAGNVVEAVRAALAE
jgi:DNA-binding NtrC family response regulator